VIVADPSALFAILDDEDDAARLAEIAIRSGPVLVSAASLLELQILTLHRRGADGLARLDAILADLAVDIVPFDRAQAAIALGCAERFGKGRGHRAQLNFGDCFSYALAAARDLPLLYKGNDFTHTDIRSA
jgi:ribonuclease VapC